MSFKEPSTPSLNEFKRVYIMCIFLDFWCSSISSSEDQEKKELLFRRAFSVVSKGVLYSVLICSQQLTLPDDFPDSGVYTQIPGSEKFKKFIFSQIRYFTSILWVSGSTSINWACGHENCSITPES